MEIPCVVVVIVFVVVVAIVIVVKITPHLCGHCCRRHHCQNHTPPCQECIQPQVGCCVKNEVIIVFDFKHVAENAPPQEEKGKEKDYTITISLRAYLEMCTLLRSLLTLTALVTSPLIINKPN